MKSEELEVNSETDWEFQTALGNGNLTGPSYVRSLSFCKQQTLISSSPEQSRPCGICKNTMCQSTFGCTHMLRLQKRA